MTKKQSERYGNDGYLFLENFFTPDEIANVKAELASYKAGCIDKEAQEIVREPGGDAIRSIFSIHANNETVRTLSLHHKLQQIVTYLLGGEVYVHQSRVNFKPGFTGKEFYWHSDFETWHGEDGMPSMRALSCSLPLRTITISTVL